MRGGERKDGGRTHSMVACVDGATWATGFRKFDVFSGLEGGEGKTVHNILTNKVKKLKINKYCTP